MKRVLIAAVALMLLGNLAYAKVIGRVNGYPITERSANDFLKVVTKGKLTYKKLRKKDKKDVIKRLAVDSLLIGMAKKHLSQQEINQVIVNYWLARKIQGVKVKSSDVKKAYTENKKYFKDPKGKILPFAKVKDVIEVSLKQKKYVADLMKRAKITMGKTVIVSPKKGNKSSSSAKRGKKSKKATYKVQSGNTLSGIAHKYHITIKELREMNHMKDTDTLKVGQKLKVPGK